MPHIVHRHHRRTYKLFCSSLVVGLSGAGKNEAMKRILLWVLALAVIPVGVDAQGTPSASCADIGPSSALEDVRSCAEQGDADAQTRLGRMYAIGEGVPEDYAEAIRWFRLAIEQGNAVAQNGLAVMYSRGWGVPEDYVEAARWYRLAAEQGYASAQSNLGLTYLYGAGLPQDYAEAAHWVRLAAEQGDADAQFVLGTLYDNGDGVEEDNVLAYMWHNLAVAQGNESAQEGKDIVEQQMTGEQIAEAQRLFREWLEAHSPGGN